MAVIEVSERDFEERVIERSRELPVIVDFWAEWCGPCRVLGPVLEAAVAAHAGELELAKVNTDENPLLAQAFGISGIPAVKAFRDGRVVAEFTGAIPRPQVEEFCARLVPSPAERLAAQGGEENLRRALELDPRNAVARRELGRLLLRRGEPAEAAELLAEADGAGDFIADGLAARAQLELAGPDGLAEAFSAWDDGDAEGALERLQEAIAGEGDPERRDLLRRAMVAIFTELGPAHPLAREHRRRLAMTLS